MMRVGLFGGTFDPIHKGHINAAREFYRRAKLDKLYVVPTGIPPHKQRFVTPAHHRMNMVNLAFADSEKHGMNVEVSDMEIVREGKSYTYLTVEELEKRNKCGRIYVYTGTDMFCTLEEWKNPAELFALCVFAAAPRDEGDALKLRSFAERYEKLYGAECMVMDFIPVEMSSTEIRDFLTKHRNGNYDETETLLTNIYLTAPVAKYIIDNGLYL